MRIAALILGIIGGLAGLAGALFAFAVGGLAVAVSTAGTGPSGSEVVGIAGGALIFSILGIIGASLALAKPKASGVLMIVAAIGGLISVSFAYMIAAPLLFIGGLLALFAKKPIVQTA